MSYRFRPAAPRDRDTVFAFCATTWPNGDYIPLVWDAWLAEPDGAFVVGVDAEDVPFAVGKLSVAAPGEGWLQGLRVDPTRRRGGWGRALLLHLVEQGWARDLHTLRFLTDWDNTPMHRLAPTLGFAKGGAYHPHRAEAGDASAARLAQPSESEPLWATVEAILEPNALLRWRGWTAARATAAWFANAVSEGRVLVAADDRSCIVMIGPIPSRLLGEHDADVALLAGAADAYTELLAAARTWAARAGATRLLGLLPPAAAPAAAAGGWLTRTEHPMSLYIRTRSAPDADRAD